jgi:DNA-binding response OmpR family regulator
MKILIVDDDPDTIVFLSAWLEDHGYECCSASDGARGMAAVASERPDLILLDVKMPNESGAQLYRNIKSQGQWGDIPVIFISGVEELHIFDSECSPLPQPAGFVPKPIDFKVLGSTIRKALERSSGAASE